MKNNFTEKYNKTEKNSNLQEQFLEFTKGRTVDEIIGVI